MLSYAISSFFYLQYLSSSVVLHYVVDSVGPEQIHHTCLEDELSGGHSILWCNVQCVPESQEHFFPDTNSFVPPSSIY